MELLALVWSFFKIGVVSFGGGWTVVGLIKAETVPRWIDEAGFASLVAIAQATPGPVALNAATLVGWRGFGILGALAATLSVVAFPVLAIAAAGLVGRRLRLDQTALKEALKTGTLAMMMMTFWVLLPKEGIDPFLALLGAASFALVAFTKISPLWAIFGAGAANLAFRTLLPALLTLAPDKF
ncbi:MAG: chromate transporter [Spirochaetaceae bacterium]|nr:chromate transporter [Spirochaetaceae bacterium]